MNLQAVLSESVDNDPSHMQIVEAQIQILTEVSIKDIGEKIKSFFRWIWEQIKKFGRMIKGIFVKEKNEKIGEKIKKVQEKTKSNDVAIKVEEKAGKKDGEESTALIVITPQRPATTSGPQRPAAPTTDLTTGGPTSPDNPGGGSAYCPIDLFLDPSQIVDTKIGQTLQNVVSNLNKAMDDLFDLFNKGKMDEFKSYMDNLDVGGDFNDPGVFFTQEFRTELEKVSGLSMDKLYYVEVNGDNPATASMKIGTHKNVSTFMNKACIEVCKNKMKSALGNDHLSSMANLLMERYKTLINRELPSLQALENSFEKSLSSLEKTANSNISKLNTNNENASSMINMVRVTVMQGSTIFKFGNYLMGYMIKQANKSISALKRSVDTIGHMAGA